MKPIKILLAVVSAVVMLAAGCSYSDVSSVQGSWQIDFEKTLSVVSTDMRDVVLSMDITIDKFDAYVSFELAENCEEVGLTTGLYNVQYYSGGDVRLEYGDYSLRLSMYDGYLAGNIKFKISGESDSNSSVYFSRSGGTAEIPDIKPNPTPDPEPVGSQFAKIKAAYKDAGYNVELENDDSLDASMKTLVSNMQAQYSALGYDICFIGKNLESLTGAEMYMLISAKTESEAAELQVSFEEAYKTARKGRDLMVFIWVMGEPDFDIFFANA